MIRWVFAALLLAIAPPVVAAEPADELDQALELFTAHKYDEAAERYGRIAADFAARYPAGEKRYYCSKSGAEALLYMTMAAVDHVSAVALGPQWCEALFMQAYSYVELDRTDLALAPLERAAELAPYDAQVANELGFVYRSLGRLDKAMDSYRKALAGLDASPDTQRMDQRKAVALRGIGWIHSERREWDEAEASFNQSLEVDPGNANALSELDYIAKNRGKE